MPAEAADARSDAATLEDRGLSEFSPIRQRKASDEVLAVLVDAMRGGLYDIGDLLPPERDLAERLNVSRTVLREAIDALRSEGIVTVRRGGRVVSRLQRRRLRPLRTRQLNRDGLFLFYQPR